MTSVDDFLRALPMREIKERAGTYGNCGGVAFAYVHLEAGSGQGGVEMVDALENLPDYGETWRDVIAELIAYIGEGITQGFQEAFDGQVPSVRVLIYMIDPHSAHPAYHRRAGRQVAEEAVRRAGQTVASVDDVLRALPIRGVDVRVGTQTNCGGIARAVVDLEPGGIYPGVEIVDAVPPDPDLYVREIAEMCVRNIEIGARSAFRVLLGAEPAVKLVVHKVLPHLVDANEMMNRRAGRRVVEEVLRRL